MKLQVTQENFARALANCARVASTRGTLPVLSNILIKTVGNRLSVAATNLDIAVTHLIGSKVKEEGAITIPARLTQDFISSLPPGIVDLELDGNKLHISTEKYQSTINGIPAEEYPVMPSITGGKTFKLDAVRFKESLSRVIFAAGSDEIRPLLTGVLLHTHNKKLYAVATDSYRLAEIDLGPSTQSCSLLIPAVALHDVLRVIPDGEGEITITFEDQQVLFESGDVQLLTRLIDGSYPDYRKLIPSTFDRTAQLSTADFTSITKVSSLFARESAGSVTIELDEKKQEVLIRSIASQLGQNTAEANAKVSSTGSITLNSRYVIDALQAIKNEEVELCFNGKLEPCVLRGVKQKEYVHVIMPLKS